MLALRTRDYGSCTLAVKHTLIISLPPSVVNEDQVIIRLTATLKSKLTEFTAAHVFICSLIYRTADVSEHHHARDHAVSDQIIIIILRATCWYIEQKVLHMSHAISKCFILMWCRQITLFFLLHVGKTSWCRVNLIKKMFHDIYFGFIFW